jgi:hypothetical protein
MISRHHSAAWCSVSTVHSIDPIRNAWPVPHWTGCTSLQVGYAHMIASIAPFSMAPHTVNFSFWEAARQPGARLHTCRLRNRSCNACRKSCMSAHAASIRHVMPPHVGAAAELPAHTKHGPALLRPWQHVAVYCTGVRVCQRGKGGMGACQHPMALRGQAYPRCDPASSLVSQPVSASNRLPHLGVCRSVTCGGWGGSTDACRAPMVRARAQSL